MAVMENVVRVGKTYKVRKRIPPECRAGFGGVGEFKTISLNTTDKREAQKRAVPVLAEIDAKIAEIRGLRATLPSGNQRLNPARVEALIGEWRFREIDRAYHDTYNGQRDSRDPIATSQLRYALQHQSTINRIADFDVRMAAVLGVTPSHPVVHRPDERERFRMAWHDIETFIARFPTDLSGWPEEQDALPPTTTPDTLSGMRLSELRDAWDAFKPLEPKKKGYIRRLIEYLGDVDIATVTPIQMDRFMAEMKRLPLSKRPTDNRLTFGELIAKYEGKDQARLSERTLYVWTTVYKAMFEYAVTRRLLTHNPAFKMMAKPTQEEPTRTEYSEADLDFLFTRPLFRGFDGPDDFGYRDKPGPKVVKDYKYWLPILAMHTGMRLDEMATLKVAELIEQDGILAFDLRSRPLTGRGRVKNLPSKRFVPLHCHLIDLGFVEWARGSRDPDGFIFPSLKFDARDKRGSQFSKWWGHWSNKNAGAKGQGIADPMVSFHSFRHTFKRAARETVDRDIHDILTGHTDGSVSAGYGRGVSLPVLKSAMDKIEVRWP